ncbi:unnamed protein product [Caenorhabditis brenneri]
MEDQIMNEIFKFDANRQLDRQQIILAVQKDEAQNQFIDRVFNTKQAAEEVYRVVDKLLVERYCLEKGKKIKTKSRVTCQETTKNARRLLEILKYSAESISETVQYPVENMEKCHEVAKNIITASIQYENVLTQFQVSLENETVDESISLLEKVDEEHKMICSLLNSFPALHKKNHRLEAIEKNVRNITRENS